MQYSLEGAGFTKDDYCEMVRRLHVLLFHIDHKGDNIMSHINGTIVFMDRGCMRKRVLEGDLCLCSAELRNNVYYAMSLKKITSSMIMGFSDDIRERIVNSLWVSNRQEFVKVFIDRYRPRRTTAHAKRFRKRARRS